MYICVCNAVTEDHIRQAVNNGATRMRDLRAQLGVAEDCCCCAAAARECLGEALQQRGGARLAMAELAPCVTTLKTEAA